MKGKGRLLCSVLLLCNALLLCHSIAPVVFVPGFMSSQLVAWKRLQCDEGGIDIGERVWIDVTHVLRDNIREECFIKCMSLSTANQTDPEDGCKLRSAGDTLLSIMELDPGQFTGKLSTVFRTVITTLTQEYNYEPQTMISASYDWRLPPMLSEERDMYYTKLKRRIEEIVIYAKQPVTVIAHSLDNIGQLDFLQYQLF